MRRLLLLTVTMFLAACGGSDSAHLTDYSPQYVGTYSGSYTSSVTFASAGQVSGTYNAAFQITAGTNASDLVWGGSCGLSGHASDASNFITFQTTCTAHDPASNCDYIYSFQAGNGTKNGNSMTMNLSGTATANCPGGHDSGPITAVYHVTKI